MNLSLAELRVYLVIEEAAQRGSRISDGEIASRANLARRNVIRARLSLLRSGHIFAEHHPGAVALYETNLTPAKPVTPTSQVESKPVTPTSQEPVTPTSQVEGSHPNCVSERLERPAFLSHPETARQLRLLDASDTLIARILSLIQECQPDITDEQVVSILRACWRDGQRGPGLFVYTVPEFLHRRLREMQAAGVTLTESQRCWLAKQAPRRGVRSEERYG